MKYLITVKRPTWLHWLLCKNRHYRYLDVINVNQPPPKVAKVVCEDCGKQIEKTA